MHEMEAADCIRSLCSFVNQCQTIELTKSLHNFRAQVISGRCFPKTDLPRRTGDARPPMRSRPPNMAGIQLRNLDFGTQNRVQKLCTCTDPCPMSDGGIGVVLAPFPSHSPPPRLYATPLYMIFIRDFVDCQIGTQGFDWQFSPMAPYW